MPWKSKVHDPLRSVRRQIANAKARAEYRMDKHRWMYNLPAWRDERTGIKRARLSMEPRCRECMKAGVNTAATEVDHVVAHRGDMALFLDIDNTQSLCKRCHSVKTSKEKQT